MFHGNLPRFQYPKPWIQVIKSLLSEYSQFVEIVKLFIGLLLSIVHIEDCVDRFGVDVHVERVERGVELGGRCKVPG